jgi:hypothetical protein
MVIGNLTKERMPLRGLTMNAKELADAVKGAGDNSFNDQASRMLLLQQAEIEELKAEKLIHDEAYISQMKEIQKLKERIKFLEDKAIMVDNSETEFGFQSLFGEDMLEVNQRITNMLRSMVNEEFEKELKKAKEK